MTEMISWIIRSQYFKWPASPVISAIRGNLHGYPQEMNNEVLSKFDVMSVAEGGHVAI